MEHVGYFLHDIYFNKKSGILVFKQKRVQKYLFFQDGVLVFAKSTHPQELIGEILLKLGRISVETYKKIDQYIDPMESLGKILIRNKIISEKDLIDGLLFQMREITLNTFPHFDGKLSFQKREDFRQRTFSYKMDVLDLIEEGIRRMDWHPYFQEFMAKKFPVPKKMTLIDRLTREERILLEAIDGSATAGKIFQSSGMDKEFFWMSLYLFHCLDLIDLLDEKKVEEKKPRARKKAPGKKVRAQKAPPSKKEKKKAEAEKEPPPPVMDDELKEKIAEVGVFREKMSVMDYYQILKVSRTASADEIKKAYFDLARKFHPDRFGLNLPAGAKEEVDGVFAQVTKAFQTLSNERERERYGQELEAPPEQGKEDVEKKAEARFRQARSLYNRARHEDALVLLEEAIRLKSNKAAYHLLLAKAEMEVPSFRRKAEEDFKKAIDLEPWNPEAHVGLGQYYKREGLNVKADRQFKKALDVNPDHKIARRELGEEEEEKKKKGLMGLFSLEGLRKKKKKTAKPF